MNEVPFGFGVLSQGEVITSPDQDRLVAKRAWLQLWEYLSRQDEFMKAMRLPVPSTLDRDFDIRRALSETRAVLSRFASRETLMQFIEGQEPMDRGHIEACIKGAREVARYAWLYRHIMAENPLTVLDVGCGYGEFAVLLARSGIHVTAVAPLESKTAITRDIVKDEKLPIEWIHGLFEELDFGETRFDVVVAGEILEHVEDDVAFLEKAVNLAKNLVLLTTPSGAVEEGFLPPDDSFHNHRLRGHVRAYSVQSLKALLGTVPGVTVEKLEEVKGSGGYRGQGIKCFLVKLRKGVGHGDNVAAEGAPYLPPGAKLLA